MNSRETKVLNKEAKQSHFWGPKRLWMDTGYTKYYLRECKVCGTGLEEKCKQNIEGNPAQGPHGIWNGYSTCEEEVAKYVRTRNEITKEKTYSLVFNNYQDRVWIHAKDKSIKDMIDTIYDQLEVVRGLNTDPNITSDFSQARYGYIKFKTNNPETARKFNMQEDFDYSYNEAELDEIEAEMYE